MHFSESDVDVDGFEMGFGQVTTRATGGPGAPGFLTRTLTKIAASRTLPAAGTATAAQRTQAGQATAPMTTRVGATPTREEFLSLVAEAMGSGMSKMQAVENIQRKLGVSDNHLRTITPELFQGPMAPAEVPFYKRPIVIAGGLAAIGIGAIFLMRGRRSTAQRLSELMAEATCVKQDRSGNCYCWAVPPHGNMVCAR